MDLTKRKFIFLGVAVFWLLIAVLNLSQTYLSSYARDWEFIWVEQLTFASGWLLWIAYTPLIFLLVKRNPIDDQIGWKFIRKNILIALGFALIHCTLDILLQFSLWNMLIGPKEISDFYGSFYYRYHVNVFIFLFIAGASYTVDYLKRSRELELEKAALEGLLNEAKLASLKMQIQPHFLFNTHHNIVGLMMKAENEKAILMLTKLSDLLRKTLDLGDQQFVTLKEELELLRTYLDIHEIRFNDRLKVSMNVDSTLLTNHFPLMLLQPLVENSLKHGISKSSSAGQLNVVIADRASHIDIRITDDGPGVTGEINKGVGLTTTKKRLEHLFGEDFILSTRNITPTGFAVHVQIPKVND